MIRRCLVLIGLIAALTAAWPADPAVAKSFVFSRVAIDAAVTSSGALRIVESRTYRFDGSFSWATYRLPLSGASRIHSIRVADERGPYVAGMTRRPGAYLTRGEGNTAIIEWGFSAADESRTFTISYVLEDVVTVHSDVAELYWKFIGTDWDVGTEDVRVTVRLPGSVPVARIRVWAHGPLQGDVRPVPGGALLVLRHLPASSMVEGRIVFPREAVPQARKRRAAAGLPGILREEQAWAAQANRQRTLARVTQFGLVALPLLILGIWVALYVRFGREHDPASPEGYYRELPGTYPPAELGVLWRFGAVQPADFVATILDLARRGCIKIETGVTEGFLGIGRQETYTLSRTGTPGGLQSFESEVLAMLFGQADATGDQASDSVTLSRRGGLPADIKKRIGRKFSAWTRMVKDAARVEKFFDETSMRVSTGSYVAGFAVVFLGWFGAIAAQSFIGIAAVVISAVVLFAGGGALKRRSQRGADDLRRWQGFRRFLLDFSEMPRAELPSVAIWEHYLVYAVPLGVADRVIQQLGKIYPAEELARSRSLGVWSTASSSGGGSGLGALAGFTTALAAATSSASSGSGSGGGFSGGGGGGGGGSGGSAG